MTVARVSSMQPKIVQPSEAGHVGGERVDAWPRSTLMDMTGHEVGGTSAGKTAITKE
jgi:prolyl-tRNA editing enzyme YbaK/EbsC (Cys-tRNA(Pro) deacylase)